MANNPKLQTAKRTLFGRKIKQLRKKGITPANIFGKNIKSKSIQIDSKDFSQVFELAGETGLIDLQVEGEKKAIPVIVSNVQADPVTDQVLHVDFRQVDLTQKITASVPLEITGEAPAVKELNGILVQSLDELEVEALPTDFPEKIDLDISSLTKIGDSLSIGDIKLAANLELQQDKKTIIVIIQEPKIEEEPEEPEETESQEDQDSETQPGQDKEPSDSPKTEQKPQKDQSEDKKESS